MRYWIEHLARLFLAILAPPAITVFPSGVVRLPAFILKDATLTTTEIANNHMTYMLYNQKQ